MQQYARAGSRLQPSICCCAAGELTASNWAILGLGPFGTWRIEINGIWLPTAEATTVDVSPVKAVLPKRSAMSRSFR